MVDGGEALTKAQDAEELCLFFRRGGGRYELLQAQGASAGMWRTSWTFAARDTHAAEKAGWMMRRLVDPRVVPVRHACRARLRPRSSARTGGTAPPTADVVVVTILPVRIQFVLLLGSGSLLVGLPFLRCGGAETVAAAMGLAVPTEET